MFANPIPNPDPNPNPNPNPDKFVARWGSRFPAEEREALLLRVKQVAQCLTELLHRPG